MDRREPGQPGNREVQSRAAGAVGEVHSSNEASNDRGAKGPQFKVNAEAARARAIDVGMSLATPQTVRPMQSALYATAKTSRARGMSCA